MATTVAKNGDVSPFILFVKSPFFPPLCLSETSASLSLSLLVTFYTARVPFPLLLNQKTTALRRYDSQSESFILNLAVRVLFGHSVLFFFRGIYSAELVCY